VTGPDGKTRPVQTVSHGHYWGHDYLMVAFPVSVPGLGYSLYTVTEAEAPAITPSSPQVRQMEPEHHCSYAGDERRHEGLDNGLVRLELDPATGGIRRLMDLRRRCAVIDQPVAAPVLEYLIERSKKMTAWSMDEGLVQPAPVLVSLKRTGAGPYQAALEASYRVADSEMTVTYTLRAGDPRVSIGIQGTWFQRGSARDGVPALRLSVPLALTGARGRYEIPFGAIDRDMNRGEEVPALQWAHITGRAGRKAAGVLLANDSKHGYSLDGHILRLTLIRSAFDPDPLPEIGHHTIQVTLESTDAGLPVARAMQSGNDLNHPLRVVGTDVHEGRLPMQAQLASIKSDAAVLTGLKMAEQGDGLIVRLCETSGRNATADIRLDARIAGKVTGAVEVDLMERTIPSNSARTRGQTVSVRVPARGLATVRIGLKKT
jgi:alpha-mannosidase